MLDRPALERWALFGGHWQVIELSERRAVVQLCECTGEAVERLATEDPEAIRLLRG